MRRVLIAIAFAAVIAPTWTAAAEGPRSTSTQPNRRDVARAAVFVEHTGSDDAGRAFVQSLRRALETSSEFRLTESELEAEVVLVVVSVSPASTAGVASAVSLAYVANNEWRSLLGTAARFVGRNQAEAMGRATLIEMSAVMSAYAPPGSR